MDKSKYRSAWGQPIISPFTFECDQCGETFAQPVSLMDQMNLHGDKKPSDCKQCGK